MKKQLLLLIMMLLPMVASADAVEIDGIYYNLISKGKVAEVTQSPNKYSGNLIIPESVTYNEVEYNVTKIGYMAFYNCSRVYSITIPNSVTSIGQGAFYQCTGLKSITIPNSITSIENQAFFYCPNLNYVYITDIAAWCNIIFHDNDSNPFLYAKHLYINGEELKDLVIPSNVTSIGKYTFLGCSGLTSVTIPSSVTSIGEAAFNGCSSLISVTIPTSVTSIGKFAFCGCSSLTSVTISSSVTSIGESTFKFCSSLTSVTIPNSIKYIGNYAFLGCTGLTSLTLGNGVQSIKSMAFGSCPNITDVYCYVKNAPSTQSDAFKDSYIEYATLHVPAESADAYKTTSPWSGFSSIIALTANDQTTSIKLVQGTEEKDTGYYDLSGRRLNEKPDQKGVYIHNGRKIMVK